jgi:diaminohydroxyphosphoribosylaminopyrimidine deaminase/5-amino-6-(5-phosphoribosylamino)uracil reductase
MNSSSDEKFMRLALREARKGLGRTSPNPCVGAVIVKDGRVIARGYHKKAGAPHAEVNAIAAATESVRAATIYVTLEPCNHTGKTPPCSRLLVESGISRVVVGMSDPNPLVDGKGIEYLRSQGVEVVSGILEKECEEINQPFIKYITQRIPWVVMKAGVSLDGKLNYQHGQSGWITGEESARAVHAMRDRIDAILVGRRTIEIDNPSLTARPARGKGKDPVRIVVDSQLTTPLSSKVYRVESPAPTWVFHATDAPQPKIAQFLGHGIRLFAVERKGIGLDLHQLLSKLGEQGISSVLVEGGAKIHGAFLKERLIDYAHLFYGPIFAGDCGVSLIEGYPVPGRQAAPRLAEVRYQRIGDDMLVSGRLRYADESTGLK